jgi:predicted nucleic acid-binding protein
MTSANQITDHYLIALARQHHLTLATFDGSLANAFADESDLVQLVR